MGTFLRTKCTTCEALLGRVCGNAHDAWSNLLESCSIALNMESRNIALLGALLFICRPASAFVSVVGPVTANNGGAGLSAPRSPSAPWNEHARGQQPVSSLAGRRSRAGTALSMGAKSVRSCAVACRGRVGGQDAFVILDGGPDGAKGCCVRSRTAARMICMSPFNHVPQRPPCGGWTQGAVMSCSLSFVLPRLLGLGLCRVYTQQQLPELKLVHANVNLVCSWSSLMSSPSFSERHTRVRLRRLL